MTSTTLLSDIVLPAATWYEKHDLSTTDMHPFVHAFTPAIDPPWEAKSDFEMFHAHRPRAVRSWPRPTSAPATTWSPCRCSTTPRARPHSPAASSATGRAATSRPIPGQTMPALQMVERDYTAIADKLASIGPLADTLGFTVKNVTFRLEHAGGPAGRVGRGDARRRRRRPTGDRHRREDRRGHPDASPAPPTASWPPRASGPWSSGSASRCRPGRGLGGEADHLRPDPGGARCR